MIRRLILSLVLLLGLSPVAFAQSGGVVSIKPGSDIAVDLGPPGATACATDTGSCALNALAQRIAQRLTSILAQIGATGISLPTNSGGGLSSGCRLPSAAATTNATNCKGSAGRMYAVRACNAGVGTRWIKLYDKATAPTVGTDIPAVNIGIPAGQCYSDMPWGILGKSFASGIGYGLTVGAADADTTALTSGDILGLNLDYF